MLEWIIAQLQVLQSGTGWAPMLALAKLAGSAIATIASVVAAIYGAWTFIATKARGKYQIAIDRMETVEKSCDAATELARKRGEQIAALETALAAEREKQPQAFLKALDKHERDGMWEHQVRDARAFIDGQQAALHRAFRILAQRHIETAVEDGAAGFENARLYALGAVAADPQDRLTRMLAEELAQGASILAAAPGARIRLADDDARESRLASLDEAGTSVTAIYRACLKAREDGAFAVMRELAQHGVRQARRADGPEAQNILVMRFYAANALQLTGQGAQALSEARALLPLCGKVSGAEHPDTLGARSLIARCLIDLDRHEEARAVHGGVLETLRAKGFTEDQRRVKRARQVEALLEAVP